MKEQASWSSIVGMPDAADKKNIQYLIATYEKTFPGQIDYLVRSEKEEERANAGKLGVDPFLVKNKQSDFRKVIAIPAPLVATLKESYPTIFKDKNHFAWFVKNFPQFRVAEKY